MAGVQSALNFFVRAVLIPDTSTVSLFQRIYQRSCRGFVLHSDLGTVPHNYLLFSAFTSKPVSLVATA
jgi:hypothetical protein